MNSGRAARKGLERLREEVLVIGYIWREITERKE